MHWKEPIEINDRFQPWADILMGAVIVALLYIGACWVWPCCGVRP